MPPLRRLILCACAAAGFIGIAILLHHLAPLRVPEVTPKLSYLQSHLADFDTVFIGSSRIYHGFSPRLFDAATAAAGKPTRTFNLAVNGLMPPESLHIARTLLSMHPPRLRRIFLEIASSRGLPDAASPTVRDVYWQDPHALIYGWQRALRDYQTTHRKDPLSHAWDDILRSARLFSRNQLNIGRLIPTPAFASLPPEKPADAILGPDRDGYVPEDHPLTDPERRKLLVAIDAILTGAAKPDPHDPLNQQGYTRLRDLAARQGVDLILVMAPVTTRDYHASQDAPPGAKLLAFDDPARYPALYDPAHRFDFDHLNAAGARIFSQALAQAYLSEQ